MSTSDPHRPGGATDRPDETPETDDDRRVDHVHRGDDTGRRRLPDAHEVAPTVETLDPPTPSEPETPPSPRPPPRRPCDDAAPSPSSPPSPSPARSTPSLPATPSRPRPAPAPRPPRPRARRARREPGADTGRHAIVRPGSHPSGRAADGRRGTRRDPAGPGPAAPTSPTTPEPAAEPVDAPRPAADRPPRPSRRARHPPSRRPARRPRTTTGSSPTRTPRAARRSARTSSGVIVGLILAPIGVAVLLLGESRILQAQVDGWDASTEVLGIVLVTLGLLLLGCVLLLGALDAGGPHHGRRPADAGGHRLPVRCRRSPASRRSTSSRRRAGASRSRR